MDCLNNKIPMKKFKKDLSDHSVSNKLDLSDHSALDNINNIAADNKNLPEISGNLEINFGITEYINKSNGFAGILKQRYSDFVVNEIDLNGEIVHFSDTTFLSSSCNKIEIISLLTEEQLKDLEQFQSLKDIAHEYLIKVDSISKEDRTNIHKHIRSLLFNLDSSTETRENIQYIVVKYKDNVQQRGSRIFSGKTGEYCKFVLYKENKDTQETLNFISKLLRVKVSTFSFAGTKDRRAKTSQEITAYKIEPNRLIGLNKRLKNVALGNFRICKNELKLGDLKGNHFTIVLRDVRGYEEDINKSLNSLKDFGFINYFGMQRFGTTNVPTHYVGKALLASNWLEAIDLILKIRPNDRTELCEMRTTWEMTKDAKLALKKLLHFQCVERKLLEGIQKFSLRDPLACFNSLPRNTRLMYVHAYQSYVFNRAASLRIKKLGIDVLIGDLVDDKAESNEKPIVVTEETVSNYKITDVVLPLPGYDVEYPANMVEYYKSILSEDNMMDYNFRHKNREYALSGCYRKLVVQPTDISWIHTSYTDPTNSLVESDLDRYDKNKSNDARIQDEVVLDIDPVDLDVIVEENIHTDALIIEEERDEKLKDGKKKKVPTATLR